MSGPTKANRILVLIDAGFSYAQIAAEIGRSNQYVRLVRWRRSHPRRNCEWMRTKRAAAPAYRQREAAQQAQYRRTRRAGATP